MLRRVVAPLLLAACAAPAPESTYDAPQHPFLAANGASNIHNDAYMTDLYGWSGPPDVASAEVVAGWFDGECASVTFTDAGQLVTLCVSVAGPRALVVLDPTTLEEKGRYALPAGEGGTSFAGGGYFALDDRGRAHVPTVDLHLLTVAVGADGATFDVVEDVDLAAPDGGDALTAADGGVVSALPDWSGRWWFVTEHGAVGYVDPATLHPTILRLEGEDIGNSFAVDETGGVYVVTTHALYRFDVGDDGGIATTWREVYDRGTRLKPGQVNFGSGTTPTLLDDDLVAITDNADPRMHVVVYDRRATVEGPRELCEVPVFEDDAGATDNSLIGVERSFLVENNYGYGSLTAVAGAGVTTPGFSRVLVGEDGCEVAWTADVAAPTVVPKATLPDRAVWTYEKRTDGWYVVSLDLDTGAERGRRFVGDDYDRNNHWAPITVQPDGRLYVGTVFGLTMLAP